MPENPYDDEKRRSQIAQLGGGAETRNTTLPVRPSLVDAPAPAGWDATNWSDPNMHSVKYDAGRLLYGLTRPSEVGNRVRSDEFQQRFPGSTFNGKDWIDFAGAPADGDRGGSPVHGIDVLRAANPETDSSEGLWWGAPEAEAIAASGGQGSGVDPRADNSAITRIMAELSAASQSDNSPAEREAILAMLQGGL